MIPCPVEGCRQHCRTPDTLFVHLASHHRKNEIVAALVKETAEAKTLKSSDLAAPPTLQCPNCKGDNVTQTFAGQKRIGYHCQTCGHAWQTQKTHEKEAAP